MTSLHPIDPRRSATHGGARTRERCPFLQQVGQAHAAPARPVRPRESTWPTERDARATEVLRAFARTAGVATIDELTAMLRRRTSQPLSMLTRWIVERRIVKFGWQGEYLLPLFQFERADMGVRESVSAVLDELDRTFEDWDLAAWFALPNDWLGCEAPVDVLDSDPEAVRQAARADRFIARG
jgi:hypothetical protein